MKLSERVRHAYELLESRSQNKINMLDAEEVAKLEAVVEAARLFAYDHDAHELQEALKALEE